MSNILDKIKLSGVTYDIYDSAAIHSMDGYWTSGQTESAITAATGALAETIGEELNGKADTSAVTADIEAAVSGKADSSAVTAVNDTLTAHTANTDIHVTTEDKAKWNSVSAISGYADSVQYNSNSKYMEFYHGGTSGTKVYEFDASPFLIDGMVQNVEIKDVTISGESVTCLVISFNTDAGKQDINIPLTEIFDPSNYYTTAQTDSKIEAAVSGKADSSAVTADIAAAVSGKADVSTTVTNTRISSDTQYGFTNLNAYKTINGTETMAGTFGGFHADGSDGLIKDEMGVLKVNTNVIQEKLVSSTNIKTINGNSILGSGDISVQTLPTVSGTTLIFS